MMQPKWDNIRRLWTEYGTLILHIFYTPSIFNLLRRVCHRAWTACARSVKTLTSGWPMRCALFVARCHGAGWKLPLRLGV